MITTKTEPITQNLQQTVENIVNNDYDWTNKVQDTHFTGEIYNISGYKYLSFKDGKLHNDNGPAIVYSNGTQEWYKDGKCHRDNGPAIVYSNGYKVWYKNGKYHREDGPALIYSNGDQYWYKDGIQFYPSTNTNNKDDNAMIKTTTEPIIQSIQQTVENIINNNACTWNEKVENTQFTGEIHNIQYYKYLSFKDGKRHNDNGPAVIMEDGYQSWCKDGKLHREDGPAVIYKNGYQAWYKDGNYIDPPIENNKDNITSKENNYPNWVFGIITYAMTVGTIMIINSIIN